MGYLAAHSSSSSIEQGGKEGRLPPPRENAKRFQADSSAESSPSTAWAPLAAAVELRKAPCGQCQGGTGSPALPHC